MPVSCCPACFGDRGLRKDIIPSLSKARGDCDFCGTQNVELIEPAQLADVFELLISVYDEDPTGKPLVEWLREDWKLFVHPQMRDPMVHDLLGQILGEKDVAARICLPSALYKSEGLVRWGTLRTELLHKNRYFLDEALDADRLKELLDHLIADELPEDWYRARIMSEDAPYPIERMGAPPESLATHGRANPIGIPYLYLSSLPDAAVAEIRPHTGEMACVADFKVPKALTVADLRAPRELVSPFVLADAGAIGQLRADIPFLERLGDELTRPILPRSAAIDYIPSQYLCEFIKKNGYDGVLYRSSVSSGMNLALFSPQKAVGGTVCRYTVDRVTVQVTKLD